MIRRFILGAAAAATLASGAVPAIAAAPAVPVASVAWNGAQAPSVYFHG